MGISAPAILSTGASRESKLSSITDILQKFRHVVRKILKRRILNHHYHTLAHAIDLVKKGEERTGHICFGEKEGNQISAPTPC